MEFEEQKLISEILRFKITINFLLMFLVLRNVGPKRFFRQWPVAVAVYVFPVCTEVGGSFANAGWAPYLLQANPTK